MPLACCKIGGMNADIKEKVKTLISNRSLYEAFCLLEHFQMGTNSDFSLYVKLLQGCLCIRGLKEGHLIHSHLIECGFCLPISVWTTLLDMYSKCGYVHDARSVFDNMPLHSVVSWTAMIAGYAHDGDHSNEALVLFCEMLSDGLIPPNSFTLLSAINACANLADLKSGRLIHACAIMDGFEGSLFIVNSLINMYMKCDSIEDASEASGSIHARDVVTWTILITEYAKQGYFNEAFQMFQQMRCEGFLPDQRSLSSVLHACTLSGNLWCGIRFHALVVNCGHSVIISLENTLIDMYFKCGSIDDAQRLFHQMQVHNVVTWNIMIAGYAQHGLVDKAFKAYRSMDIFPNRVTFIIIFKLCASTSDLELGHYVHNDTLWNGLALDVSLGNSLIDFYVNCNEIEDAQRVFLTLSCKDVVSWTTMILGYGQNEHLDKANEMLLEMERDGLLPNSVTFVAIVAACAMVGSLDLSLEVHARIVKCGKETETVIVNALIDTYFKCGDVTSASLVFNKMICKDAISWNSIISGYALHGYVRESLLHAMDMQTADCKPNDVTYLGLLSACSRVGLLHDGVHIFLNIIQDGRFLLKIDHYVCIMDMLARIGHINDAAEFMKRIPLDTCAVVSRTLLNGCKLHRDIELAISVIESMIDCKEDDASAFALLINIFAARESI